MKDLVGAAIEKTLQLVDVVIEHREQPAGAVLLEERQLQMLKVAIGFQAQTVLSALGQVPPKHVVEVFEQRFGAPDHQCQPCEQPELLGDRCRPHAGEHGLLAAHHDIHSQTDQRRWCQIKQLVQDRTGRRGDHESPPWCEVPDQSQQR